MTNYFSNTGRSDYVVPRWDTWKAHSSARIQHGEVARPRNATVRAGRQVRKLRRWRGFRGGWRDFAGLGRAGEERSGIGGFNGHDSRRHGINFAAIRIIKLFNKSTHHFK